SLLVLATYSAYSTQLVLPFLKRMHPDLVIHSLINSKHFWPFAFLPFLIFVAIVIAGSSNAVNLTDGLDGLAIGCTVIAAGALTVLTYVSSNYRWANYLEIQYIPRVGSFKLRGKRIFRMAPIHHHFELMGWSESKVIVRFWIAALVFALFALTTLKLR